MNKNLSLLIELQRLHLEIEKNREKEEKLSSQIKEEGKKIAKTEEDLLQKQDTLKHTQIERRKRERRIEEIDLLLAKHEEEKYKVKSKEEFAALDKEISRVEEEKGKTEDLLLELMEREEELTQNLPFLEAEAKQVREDSEKKESVLKAELDNVANQVRKLEDARTKVISQLNPVLFEQYEQLQKTREGSVVVSVSEGICKGCNVRVSPSLMARVRKKEEIVYCENCNRILFTSNS